MHAPKTITLQNGEKFSIANAKSVIENESHIFKRIGGKKCAYVTMVSGDYYHGIRALANSLKKVTDVPLVVMILPDEDKSTLAGKENVVFVDVDNIAHPQFEKFSSNNDKRYKSIYSKLNVFNLTLWDKLVFLDSDTIVLQNIDELFEIDEFAVTMNVTGYPKDENTKIFNSGVFCCQPSVEIFNDMMVKLPYLDSYDNMDQGFLNTYFKNRYKILDTKYNTLKTLYYNRPDLFNLENIKVLHFIMAKPWGILQEHHVSHESNCYFELEKMWLNFLEYDELKDIFWLFRKDVNLKIEDEFLNKIRQKKAKSRKRKKFTKKILLLVLILVCLYMFVIFFNSL